MASPPLRRCALSGISTSITQLPLMWKVIIDSGFPIWDLAWADCIQIRLSIVMHAIISHISKISIVIGPWRSKLISIKRPAAQWTRRIEWSGHWIRVESILSRSVWQWMHGGLNANTERQSVLNPHLFLTETAAKRIWCDAHRHEVGTDVINGCAHTTHARRQCEHHCMLKTPPLLQFVNTLCCWANMIWEHEQWGKEMTKKCAENRRNAARPVSQLRIWNQIEISFSKCFPFSAEMLKWIRSWIASATISKRFRTHRHARFGEFNMLTPFGVKHFTKTELKHQCRQPLTRTTQREQFATRDVCIVHCTRYCLKRANISTIIQ